MRAMPSQPGRGLPLSTPHRAASALFSPIRLGSHTIRNRIALSPMCMYSAVDGLPDDWHLAHLASRAVGGAGLVLVEATGVEPEGRITPGCTGLWNEAQADAFGRIVALGHLSGASMGIQLGHSGRKGSTHRPWEGGGPLAPQEGAWQAVAPSAIAHRPGWPVPHALAVPEIADRVEAFARSARLAQRAGFDVIELHGAHGYLLHQFLSPLSNLRTDAYGGSLMNRARFLFEVVEAVRPVWGERPLFVRLSVTDHVPEGLTADDGVAIARELKARGVDLIDCTTGGVAPVASPDVPGARTPLAARLRREAHIATAPVGRIEEAMQAEAAIRDGDADMVIVGRQALRDPYFALHWAEALGVDVEWPRQYGAVRPAPGAGARA